jgi:hypothetical protein
MKYQIQYRGNWAGSSSSRWKPAIAGTLNSTGTSDEEASTFATFESAQDVLENVVLVELGSEQDADGIDGATDGDPRDGSPEFQIVPIEVAS